MRITQEDREKAKRSYAAMKELYHALSLLHDTMVAITITTIKAEEIGRSKEAESLRKINQSINDICNEISKMYIG